MLDADDLTKAKCEAIIVSEFGEMPSYRDHWTMRKKKQAFRLKYFGTQPVCKACIYPCKVLNYKNGSFVCFKFIRKEE